MMPLSRRALDRIARATARQWAGIAQRTPTYLAAYQDRPGSSDRAQRRAEWIAARPEFAGVREVVELGCGAGRNLAALRRRYPDVKLVGLDINEDGLEAARTALPGGQFHRMNLYYFVPYDVSGIGTDLVLTCGVLSHLHRAGATHVMRAVFAAGSRLLMVEHLGHGEVLKGPWWWFPTLKRTGDYVLWAYPWADLVREAGGRVVRQEALPADLQAPGATVLVVAERVR